MAHTPTDAILARTEEDWIDFKRDFDATQAAWCEIVKDIVAMANSGGGFILIGVDDDGINSKASLETVLQVDPAVIADKIRRYTGTSSVMVKMQRAARDNDDIMVVVVAPVAFPIVFAQPGTYERPDNKKQDRAFSTGQIYFRHGPKSEPGTSEDLRAFVERKVSSTREEWLGNIRKVVEAPAGSVVSVTPIQIGRNSEGDAIPARLVHADDAMPVAWLDPNKSHPYRQTELVAEINRRIEGKGRINRHDIQLVRRYHLVEDDPNLAYKPRYGTYQYSTAFVDWLVAEFEKDPTFFHGLRERSYGRAADTSI